MEKKNMIIIGVIVVVVIAIVAFVFAGGALNKNEVKTTPFDT